LSVYVIIQLQNAFILRSVINVLSILKQQWTIFEDSVKEVCEVALINFLFFALVYRYETNAKVVSLRLQVAALKFLDSFILNSIFGLH
jgi:hypothetical protein